jgi:hypothetical protein
VVYSSKTIVFVPEFFAYISSLFVKVLAGLPAMTGSLTTTAEEQTTLTVNSGLGEIVAPPSAPTVNLAVND